MKGIYAIGDMAGRQLLAHKAMAEGVVAAEAIAGHAPRPVDYGNVPSCTYCRPQVASIGLTEAAAKGNGREVSVGRFPFTANGKAVALGDTEGFLKVVADKRTGEILGVHIVGPEATELIHEFAVGRTLEATPRGADAHHPRPPDALRGGARGHARRAGPGHPHLMPGISDFGHGL